MKSVNPASTDFFPHYNFCLSAVMDYL
uniref:Uncharacterized protein n=1 Tax=Rhizophora mucronata TaxID=61149 RepID=A0A2P2NDJ4_RHIMU